MIYIFFEPVFQLKSKKLNFYPKNRKKRGNQGAYRNFFSLFFFQFILFLEMSSFIS